LLLFFQSASADSFRRSAFGVWGVGRKSRRAGLLLRFGTVWPLVLTSIVLSLAMIPLMFGKKPQ
jgi:hypothetical protein